MSQRLPMSEQEKRVLRLRRRVQFERCRDAQRPRPAPTLAPVSIQLLEDAA